MTSSWAVQYEGSKSEEKGRTEMRKIEKGRKAKKEDEQTQDGTIIQLATASQGNIQWWAVGNTSPEIAPLGSSLAGPENGSCCRLLLQWPMQWSPSQSLALAARWSGQQALSDETNMATLSPLPLESGSRASGQGPEGTVASTRWMGKGHKVGPAHF